MNDNTNHADRPLHDGPDDGCDCATDTTDLHAISSLSGFQRDALLAIADLAGTEPSGSNVQSRLRECLRRDVSHGGLYRNLRELHDEGYILKVPLDGRTYSYRLTDVARMRLVTYLAWGIDCLDTDREVHADESQPDGVGAVNDRDLDLRGWSNDPP